MDEDHCDQKGKELVTPDKGKELVVKSNSGHAVEEEMTSPANYQYMYPKPLAKYRDVVDHPHIFRETLEKLHSTMATKFMIPVIGGRELDLHRLFVEVTSRGGLEKVIGDRRWREVTAAFSFPSTATNASFVLRKYYISLLHHYEQIYFFGSLGWNSPLPVPSMTQSSNAISYERSVQPTLQNSSQNVVRKRKSNGELASPGPSMPANRQVAGVIDGKFEHGYFVTVTIGTQKLKGVLFHTSEQIAGQATNMSGIDNNNVRSVRRRRRRKKLSKRDPTHPKPNRSGYNFFFAEQHARLKPLHPGKDREISRMIGDLWNKLTETEKAVYQEKGVKDKERYRSEMVVYRERLKMGEVISNAVPIQQRHAEPEIPIDDVDSKMEMDESDLPSPNQHESSSDGFSDSEENKSDDDSEELENSPEIGPTATESTTLAAAPLAEEDGFELRRRDNLTAKDEVEPPASCEDADSKKVVAETSTDQQEPQAD